MDDDDDVHDPHVAADDGVGDVSYYDAVGVVDGVDEDNDETDVDDDVGNTAVSYDDVADGNGDADDDDFDDGDHIGDGVVDDEM